MIPAKLNHYVILCFLFLLSAAAEGQSGNRIEVNNIIRLATNQYQTYINLFPDSTLHLYSTGRDGAIQTVGYKDWTSGFFPGCLWYMYQFTKEDKWRNYAEAWTASLAPAQWLTSKHDLGFILYTSFGNGYAISGDGTYKKILLQAAVSLSRRFNPVVGCIKSWDNGPWHYPVIVDNLMNLELLFCAAKISGDSSFLRVALSHLNTDLMHRFRPDGSTYHVLDYDSSTGKLIARKTWQGLNDSSCWARGQAWAIYSLTMAYRYTKNERYLEYAGRAAHYFIEQIKKIPDHIPYWDFDDPDIPNAARDVSSAAIAASALLELSHYGSGSRRLYFQTAVSILKSLCSDKYLATAGHPPFFILKHSVVNKPGNKGIDVPVIYADYYFLQALWRYQHDSTGKK